MVLTKGLVSRKLGNSPARARALRNFEQLHVMTLSWLRSPWLFVDFETSIYYTTNANHDIVELLSDGEWGSGAGRGVGCCDRGRGAFSMTRS